MTALALFSGIGTQWAAMGRELLDASSSFAAGLREFDHPFTHLSGWSVEQLLYRQDQDIRPAHLGHPCVLAVECGLFRLLQSEGFEPDLIMGHSGGEVAAAWACGALSAHDAALVAWRHSLLLQQASGAGHMAFFALGEEAMTKLLKPRGGKVQIAALNAPAGTVCSGDPDVLRELITSCEPEVFCRLLPVDVPFHCAAIETHLPLFTQALASIAPGAPRTPIISTVHGNMAAPGDFDALYWSRHVREPVRFEAAVRRALEQGMTHAVEISPHAVLLGHVAETATAMGHGIESVGLMCRDTDSVQSFGLALDVIRSWKPRGARHASPPASQEARSLRDGSHRERVQTLRAWIETELNQLLPGQKTSADQTFQAQGVTSLLATRLCAALGQRLGIPLPASAVFNHPDIPSLAEHLAGLISDDPAATGAQLSCRPSSGTEPLAVVGVACRLPGGINDLDDFWRFLAEGRDAVGLIPPSRWDRDRYYDPDRQAPGKMYTREAAFLSHPTPDIEEFDAHFFGISAREAAQLDPQQRLLLELSWEAFEHAGIDPFAWRGKQAGVFVAMTNNEYSHAHRESYLRDRIDAYSLTGTTMSGACGRISYFYGFEGPCFAVDTACSSGIVALHCACQSLRRGESDLALVAGVTLMLTPDLHICFSKLGAISPDGRSKTFDDSADGYGRGEGAVALVLKRLSDAERDGDRILGLVRGTAINQDGKSNGLTSPNGLAQQKVIARALADAGLQTGDVSYVEAHGTGTALGDAIELEALANAYRPRPDSLLRLGSVKANIGHLEPAAALAALAKVLLCMQHEAIPANIHVTTPNTRFDWTGRGVEAPTALVAWDSAGPRRAGMSAFGFSGVNGHAVIEEYRPIPADETEIPALPLFLSARTPQALRRLALDTAAKVHGMTPAGAAALCRSAACRHAHFPCRLAAVGRTPEELAENLRREAEQIDRLDPDARSAATGPALLFTGQGSQHPGMGRELMVYPAFRRAIDLCAEILRPEGIDLHALLFDTPAQDLARTANAQPAIVAVSYAVWRLWESFGLHFDAVAGHSIGEYPAAVAAGVMDLPDMLRLAVARGRAMDHAPDGGMAAVFASENIISPLLAQHPDLTIAAVNAPTSLTVSGPRDALRRFMEVLGAHGINGKELRVAHAFHSPAMAEAARTFGAHCERVRLREPSGMTLVSTVSGQIAGPEIAHHAYWTGQITSPVRFADAVTTLANTHALAIEAGPSAALSGLVEQCDRELQAIPSLAPNQSALTSLFQAAARLYRAGTQLCFEELFSFFPQRHEPLPFYPFERKRHWIEVQVDPVQEGETALAVPGRRLDSPALGRSVVFESVFSDLGPIFVHEHVIFGKPISPAAGHMAMLLAAGRELWGEERCELRGVDFLSPLVVEPGQTRTVQVIVDAAGDECPFTLVSRGHNGSDWQTHSSGTLVRNPGPETRPEHRPGDRFTDGETPETFYNRFVSRGYEVGPGFQRIEDISISGDMALCRVRCRRRDPGEKGHVIYPGALDSVLQTILPPFFHDLADTMMAEEALLIPLHLDSLRLWRPVPDQLWCRATAVRGAGDSTLSGQTLGVDEQGQPVLELDGFVFRMTDRATLYRQMHTDPLAHVYAPRWRPTAGISGGESVLLVLPLRGGQDRAELLARRPGIELVTVTSLTGDQPPAVPPGARLVLVHGPDPELRAHDEMDDCCTALSVLQACVRRVLPVVTVTSGVMPATPEDRPQPSGSGLWGLGGSFALEHPDLWRGGVDMPAQSWTDRDVDALLGLCRCPEPFEARAVRNGQIHESTLERITKFPDAQPLPIRGTHLITGGSGALGLELAGWLGANGARTVALISRTGIRTASGRATVDRLRLQGVEVLELEADVANPDEVRTIVARLRREAPPLCGVFHAAGILDDGVITELTAERIRSVMTPKTAALNLHHATLDDKLDHFVLYSSAGALLGTQGQANYNAGNHFLNALAHMRQALGLPATSACWGPWSRGGMAQADARRSSHLDRQGILSLDAHDALTAFQHAQPLAPCFGVMPMDWKRFAAVRSGFLARHPDGYFRTVIPAQWRAETRSDNAVTEGLLGDGTDLTQLAQGLRTLACRLLGYADPSRIATDVPLLEQGFDSLLAVEFRNRIGRELGQAVPVSMIFEYPTLDKIVQWLSSSATDSAQPQAQAGPEPAGRGNAATDALLADIDSLLGED